MNKKLKRPKEITSLPGRWSPRFLDDADKRQGVIKEIRRRVKRLESDCGADSEQKKLLVSRAVFLSCYLETLETTAAEDGKLDFGSYTQGVNALSGLLTKLGLERQAKKLPSLKTYVAGEAS